MTCQSTSRNNKTLTSIPIHEQRLARCQTQSLLAGTSSKLLSKKSMDLTGSVQLLEMIVSTGICFPKAMFWTEIKVKRNSRMMRSQKRRWRLRNKLKKNDLNFHLKVWLRWRKSLSLLGRKQRLKGSRKNLKLKLLLKKLKARKIRVKWHSCLVELSSHIIQTSLKMLKVQLMRINMMRISDLTMKNQRKKRKRMSIQI